MTDVKPSDCIDPTMIGYIQSFSVAFTHAKGSQLWDKTGKEFIDFYSAAGALSYGHQHVGFKARMTEFLRQNQTTQAIAKEQFFQTLNACVLEPRNWHYTLPFATNSNEYALDSALKLARQITGRQDVISFTHDKSLSIDDSFYHSKKEQSIYQKLGLQSQAIHFMPYDGSLGPDVDTMAYLEQALAGRAIKPAAILVEAILAEGTMQVATKHWLRALQQLCTEEGILLIANDTQIGCGRTNGFFSFDVAGLEPDLIVLSKSLSGQQQPLAVVLLKSDLASGSLVYPPERVKPNDLLYVTATYALQTYWTDQEFMLRLQNKEEMMRNWLENIVHSYPGSSLSVHGRGLTQALVTAPGSDLASAIAQQCLDQGVLLHLSGEYDEVLQFLPALTIDESLLEQGLHMVEQSVSAVMMQNPRARQVLKLDVR